MNTCTFPSCRCSHPATCTNSRAEQAEPVAWRDHVEQRLLTWRQSFVNRSGDQLALDDFMDKESLDDLIDFVCDEYTAAPVAKLEPLSEREIDLIDGMIEVQLHHAAQCDGIANRNMATKQKGWDMERVELLRKLKAAHNAKLDPTAEADKKDAERYQWLRDKSPVSWLMRVEDLPLFKGDFDAAIDLEIEAAHNAKLGAN